MYIKEEEKLGWKLLRPLSNPRYPPPQLPRHKPTPPHQCSGPNTHHNYQRLWPLRQLVNPPSPGHIETDEIKGENAVWEKTRRRRKHQAPLYTP